MTDIEAKFIHLAVIEQTKYEDIEKILKVDRLQLTQWWDSLKTEREELSKIRKIWIKKCEKVNFYDFKNWYTKTERKCFYCAITESEIKKLIKGNRIKTKRLATRGKSLEIDRKKPNEKYDKIDNLVYCCYWCNNAKTDEFSYEEFLEIGKQINKVWKARLNKVIIDER